MKYLRPMAIVLAIVAATMLPSCSPRKQSVYHVRGKVLDASGAPLAGAVVTFHPVNGKKGALVFPQGVAGKDGSYELSTYNLNDGAPAGQYKVTVILELQDDVGDRDDSRIVTASRYRDPETTDLSAEVTAHQGVLELQPFKLGDEDSAP
jgi:hypothetical protein